MPTNPCPLYETIKRISHCSQHSQHYRISSAHKKDFCLGDYENCNEYQDYQKAQRQARCESIDLSGAEAGLISRQISRQIVAQGHQNRPFTLHPVPKTEQKFHRPKAWDRSPGMAAHDLLGVRGEYSMGDL